MLIANLTTSPGFGGPEWQMLGLATSLPAEFRSHYLLFHERGRSRPFWEQLRRHEIGATILESNWPHVRATVREVSARLKALGADLLCCHGYKGDIIGIMAARRVGIPVLAISHGWTAAAVRVRVYEYADRRVMKWMDRVVAVSEGQAVKVRRAGVRPERVVVIPNAVHAERFDVVDPSGRDDLLALFPTPPRQIVGAVGRLSPEKGFDQLILAAQKVVKEYPDVGFVLVGDGPLRDRLQSQIEQAQLQGRFVLAGHRSDVDRLFPHMDALAMPSYTEGLPCVLLEAMAAGVPVVATAVGGIPEVVTDGVTGWLVPPGNPDPLADRLHRLLSDSALGRRFADQARLRVRRDYTFGAQADRYAQLLTSIIAQRTETRESVANEPGCQA